MPTANPLISRTIDKQVLSHLRVGQGISRVELARQLSIAPSTVGMYVDRLVSTGFLCERRGKTVSAGRPPTIVELNPEAGQFVGIDLDAREIYGVSVDFAQRLLRDRTEMIAARESASGVIEQIGRVIEDVKSQSRDLLGIGIAVPGTVDISRGRVLHYRHIRGWRDLALADIISSYFNVPVRIENNVRTMAFAERSFGLAKRTNNFVCLCIRSGIGAGIFIDGEIYRGSSGLAGEIGVWPCGKTVAARNAMQQNATLEEVASLRAIFDQLTQAVKNGRTTSLKLLRNRVAVDGLFRAIEAGDQFVLKTLRDSAEVVGKAVAQMSLLVDPEQILISGPLAAAEESFVVPLREAVEHYLPRNHTGIPTVSGSQLGPLAGALGAASLAVQAWQPNL